MSKGRRSGSHVQTRPARRFAEHHTGGVPIPRDSGSGTPDRHFASVLSMRCIRADLRRLVHRRSGRPSRTQPGYPLTVEQLTSRLRTCSRGVRGLDHDPEQWQARPTRRKRGELAIGGRANAPGRHLSASCPGPPTVGSRCDVGATRPAREWTRGGRATARRPAGFPAPYLARPRRRQHQELERQLTAGSAAADARTVATAAATSRCGSASMCRTRSCWGPSTGKTRSHGLSARSSSATAHSSTERMRWRTQRAVLHLLGWH